MIGQMRNRIIALAIAAAATAAPAETWVRTWQAVPSDPVAADPTVAAEKLSNVTIRMPLRLSAGGTSLRLRLSNELGVNPLPIGAVHVALAAADGSVAPGSDRVVTFAGRQGATIAPLSPLVSDSVALKVGPRAQLLVSIHVPGALTGTTVHALGVATAQFAAGDQTGAASLTAVATATKRYILSAIDVAGGSAKGTIAVFGDSITDGARSTVDADHRWHDLLAARMDKAGGGGFGIANAAISGNRLLATGAGPAALARLDRDVLSVPGIRYLVVLEGINDLGSTTRNKLPALPPETLIAAYRQLIERAHDRGVKVIGATILPYKGAGYYAADADTSRQAVNA